MRRVLLSALAASAIGIAATPANATTIVTLCSNGSGCETNDQLVNLVNSTSTNPATGNINGTAVGVTITGTGTNGSHLLAADNGQATIQMADYSPQNADLINAITFTLAAGSTFGSAEWNLESGSPTSGFTVVACVLNAQCDNVALTQPQGSNWFDILYTGAAYTSVTITAPTGDGFKTFKQLRFDHVNGPVPEPATWALMLLGFGGIGMAMRRRRARAGQLLQIA